jgi:hypothetical protein
VIQVVGWFLRGGWFISTKGVAYGTDKINKERTHGGVGKNLLGREWLGRFFVLGWRIA